MVGVTRDLLDDIFASVDAREGDSDQPDAAVNSCDDDDEESDLDFPKPLAGTSQARPQQQQQPQQPQQQARIKGLVAAPVQLRSPLTPAATNSGRSMGVATAIASSVGRGGRMVYQVSRPSSDVHYYIVQWRKPQQKKLLTNSSETWDGDAYIKVEGSKVTMLSEEGKHMATSALIGGLPTTGTELRIGQMDCEVDRAVDFEEFRRATSCLNNPTNTPLKTGVAVSMSSTASYNPTGYAKPFKAPAQLHRSRPSGGAILARPFSPVQPIQPVAGPSSDQIVSSLTPAATMATKTVAEGSFYAKPKIPPKKIVIGEKSSKDREAWGGALHDPLAHGALVMERPPESEGRRRNTKINDVVLDPILSDKMREHQREGVQFMYRCVMGMTGANGQGCILADEMGLGKTLQTIALIYTLCKQSPFENESSVITRALVVCPVSLVNNWKKEFRKWLPKDFGVVSIEDNDDSKISAFTHHRGLNVLIIGYERLRKVIKRLASCQPPVGLIVCDEGHRLKSKDNKTTKMFETLSTPRRIILTGTPVQNDLGEYWAMADFACPGVLGSYSAFSRQYEKPILKARTPKCSAMDQESGMMRSEELRDLSKEFVLRRDASVLRDYLPPKSEYVIFVSPSKLQLDVFARLLGSSNMDAIMRGMASTQCLAMIDLLRKVANSPILLRKKEDDGYEGDEVNSAIQKAISLISPYNRLIDITISGKLIALDRILSAVYLTRDEKIVIVSNWTTTLNLIQLLCTKKRYPFLRLDGSTPQKQRQELVDQFNRKARSDTMVFLLSAKAGGVGLNLIGASRLILFDSDWNPSTDLQAMARIHRDGQKKPVFIYRLLTTNSIDEKIYQRQITKTGLSDQMMAQGQSSTKDSKDSFSFEDLRDIFTVNLHTDGCQTHDLLSCDCVENGQHFSDESTDTIFIKQEKMGSDDESDEEQLGFVAASQYDPKPTPKMRRMAAMAQQAKLAALKEWRHLDGFNPASFGNINDNLIYNILREDYKPGEAINSTTTTTTTTISSRRLSEEARLRSPSAEKVPEPPTKKYKTVLDFISDLSGDSPLSEGNEKSEGSDNGDRSGALDSAAEESDNEMSDQNSDDEPVILPSRRKRITQSSLPPKPKLKKGVSVQDDLSVQHDKKHNLQTMAESGQAGRIMFVFERVSKSKL